MAIKYISFFPEPIEGQALLNNFKRTLRYKGANEVESALRRGMPLYEMKKQETVGENKDGNLVIRGECISACAYLRERTIKVDLVYIDPPFASGADYAKKIYIRRNPKVAEAIAKAEEELEDDAFREFEEKMYGDVWDKEKYLNWMYENLMAIKSVMSETASIYVHLDWHIGHYVKVLMDEIFGEDNFRNEIIWCYTAASNVGADFPKKHDTILRYSASDEYIFNKEDIRIPYAEGSIVITVSIPHFKNEVGISIGIENALVLDDIDLAPYRKQRKEVDGYGIERLIPDFQKMQCCDNICSLGTETLKKVFANLKKVIDKIIVLLDRDRKLSVKDTSTWFSTK